MKKVFLIILFALLLGFMGYSIIIGIQGLIESPPWERVTTKPIDYESIYESIIKSYTKPSQSRNVPVSAPFQAENGDIRGADNDGDGRLEPVFVRGYFRKDGTYVRSHYRAKPRR